MDYTVTRDDENAPIINYNLSWLIKQITAPNGRTIKFNYSGYLEYKTFRPWAYAQSKAYYESDPGVLGEKHSGILNSNQYGVVEYSQNGINLTRIEIDDKVSVEFHYGTKVKEKGYLTTTFSLANTGLLEKIAILNTSTKDTIKQCNMSFYTNNNPSGNQITFLDVLQISGEDKYTFNYYDQDGQFPYHGTTGIDHWGFYTKKNTYTASNLIPSIKYDSNMNEIVNTANREPKFEGGVMGMLKKITYPTKGYSIYEYESNDYYLKVGRNTKYECRPAILNRNEGGYKYPDTYLAYPAGGVRISKITDFAGSGESHYRKFIYNKYGRSTGILLHYPRYLNSITYKEEGKHYFFDSEISGTKLSGLLLDKAHISYSCVREIQNDNSYIDYHFSNYTDMPDDTTPLRSNLLFKVSILGPRYVENLDRQPISHHLQRGQLLNKMTYDCDNNLISKTMRVFDNNSDKKYIESIYYKWRYVYLHKTLVYDFPLEREITTNYFGMDSMVIEKKYTYNTKNQIIATEISTSDGKKELRKNLYPADILANSFYGYITTQPFWQFMIDNNYVQTPLISYTMDGDSKIKEATYYKYMVVSNGAINHLKLGSINKTALQTPVLNSGNIPQNWFDVETSIDQRDKFGNIVKMTNRSGISTIYIWGYDGLYPIAKIDNLSDLSIITKIPGLSDIQITPLSGYFNATQEQALLAILNSQVTLYNYKPHVGVTKITASTGIVSTYDYDDFGRLISVKDDQGRLLYAYDYNYRNGN